MGREAAAMTAHHPTCLPNHLIVALPPELATRIRRHCLATRTTIAILGRAAVADILARPSISMRHPGDPSGMSRIGIPLAPHDDRALLLLSRQMRLPMSALAREGLWRLVGGRP